MNCLKYVNRDAKLGKKSLAESTDESTITGLQLNNTIKWEFCYVITVKFRSIVHFYYPKTVSGSEKMIFEILPVNSD